MHTTKATLEGPADLLVTARSGRHGLSLMDTMARKIWLVAINAKEDLKNNTKRTRIAKNAIVRSVRFYPRITQLSRRGINLIGIMRPNMPKRGRSRVVPMYKWPERYFPTENSYKAKAAESLISNGVTMDMEKPETVQSTI